MSEFVGSEKNRSISDDGSYIAAVREAASDPVSFARFKRDPRYTAILEHASIEQGEEYLNIIKKQSPDFIARITDFKENDLEGGATTHEYCQIGPISPSTLRYLKVASDLRMIFGQVVFDTVAEVGIGYGGQLLINDKIFKFREYHLLDLPPVLTLTSKYLECHVLDNCYRPFTLNQHNGSINYDLSMSNYAFSELPAKTQVKYIEKVFSKSKRGYLTMNSGLPESAFTQDKLTLFELKALLPKFEILDEQPVTHPANYIIVWGA